MNYDEKFNISQLLLPLGNAGKVREKLYITDFNSKNL